MASHEIDPVADQAGRPLRADARRNRTRILEAAEAVFAAKGRAASTEEIAQLAGVGIGTVFRHFPTKEELLRAITGAQAAQMAADIEKLRGGGDPATAFFAFFTGTAERAARTKTVIDLLAEAGIDVSVTKPVHVLRKAIAELLTNAQRAGAVREDVGVAEVIALLVGVCQAIVHTPWDPDVRNRTLAIVFDGLRPKR
jgi:AcrR family transcriptional regulator